MSTIAEFAEPGRLRSVISAELTPGFGKELAMSAATDFEAFILASKQFWGEPKAINFGRYQMADLVKCAGDYARLGRPCLSGALCQAYLYPKKGGGLAFTVNHRFYASRSLAAGFLLTPHLIGKSDQVAISFGEVIQHDSKPGDEPAALDKMVGIYLTIKNVQTGAVLGRPYIEAAKIAKVRASGGSVWNSWPLEMAQAAAIRHLAARGALPFQLPSMDSDHEEEEEDPSPVSRLPPAPPMPPPSRPREPGEDDIEEETPPPVQPAQALGILAESLYELHKQPGAPSKGDAEYGPAMAAILAPITGGEKRPAILANTARLREVLNRLAAEVTSAGGAIPVGVLATIRNLKGA